MLDVLISLGGGGLKFLCISCDRLDYFWRMSFNLLYTGPCQDKDGEEGRSGHHREVLHPPGQWLPHQQACVRGDRHHPQQEAPQQDRRVRDWLEWQVSLYSGSPVSKVTVVSGCQVIDTTGRENRKFFPCLLDVFLPNPVSFTQILYTHRYLNFCIT